MFVKLLGRPFYGEQLNGKERSIGALVESEARVVGRLCLMRLCLKETALLYSTFESGQSMLKYAKHASIGFQFHLR